MGKNRWLWWVLNASGRDFPLKQPVGSHGATHRELEQQGRVDQSVTLTQNQDMIQQFTSDTANEALAYGVSFGGFHGCMDHIDASALSDAFKPVAELAIVVPIKHRDPSSNGMALRHYCATQAWLTRLAL
ncbi:MAG: hypothetical protein JW963_02335 [Anaerolineales bacterium]|nr:hypothetical protein [Anaerolineales bacterium]